MLKKVVLVFAQRPISASFFSPEEHAGCICAGEKVRASEDIFLGLVRRESNDPASYP
jgi:hypothetical protein